MNNIIKGVHVLDHGYVELLDVMPSDRNCELAIVEAARVSTNQGSKGAEADLKLLKYLYKNKHTSPFEMVEFKFKIKLPIFIARQWIRHRTANVNEYSMRYIEAINEYYVPEEWGIQDTINKQGSLKRGYSPQENEERWAEIDGAVRAQCDDAFKLYNNLIDNYDIAREQARIVLPLSTYTLWYWKIDLHNLLNFLRLRLHPHAQKEIRDYAQALVDLITPLTPNVIKLMYDDILVPCIKCLGTGRRDEMICSLCKGKGYV